MFQPDVHRMPANLQRPLERHGAAHSQREAMLDEGLRLLRTAIERVRDPADARMAAQVLQKDVLGFAHMQQHGQAELDGHVQLRGVEVLLALARLAGGDFRHEKIQSDLANGDKARITERLLDGRSQRVQVGVVGALDEQGVNPQRIGAASDGGGQIAHDLEVGPFDGGDHDGLNARMGGVVRHFGAIGVELGGVQMAVGVDQHGRVLLVRIIRPRPPRRPAPDGLPCGRA
jgi:hypothetical protein